MTVAIATSAVETVAKDATFHPVRDYLAGLQWDRTERIARFATNYLGAEATPYHEAISRCMFIVMAASRATLSAAEPALRPARNISPSLPSASALEARARAFWKSFGGLEK